MRKGTLAVVCGGALVAGVALGCSSSTKPSDPLVGSWRVSFDSVPAGTTLSPAAWTITVSKSGAVYTGTWPNLTWAWSSNNAAIDTWTAASDSSTFEIKGDSLLVLGHDDGAPKCFVGLAGTISGASAQGRIVAFADDGTNSCIFGAWKWSAAKQ